jgi:hypothetical protein
MEYTIWVNTTLLHKLKKPIEAENESEAHRKAQDIINQREECIMPWDDETLECYDHGEEVELEVVDDEDKCDN